MRSSVLLCSTIRRAKYTTKIVASTDYQALLVMAICALVRGSARKHQVTSCHNVLMSAEERFGWKGQGLGQGQRWYGLGYVADRGLNAKATELN